MKKFLLFGIGIGLFVPSVSAIGIQFFSDVSTNPYKEAIYHLQKEDIVRGYDDGTFKPDAKINRAEFLKIVLETFYTTEIKDWKVEEPCFDDIRDIQNWYVKYACFAKSKGIISGYEDRYLKPANTIVFVEAAKIITNTAGSIIEPGEEIWYEPFVRYLLDEKLLPLSVTQFEQELDRGIMAEMMSRMIRMRDGVLTEYLDFRKQNYGETVLPTWEDLSGNQKGKTSSQSLIESYKIERYNRKIVEAEHPGKRVDGAYLAHYDEWTPTSYSPSLQNQSLSLEKESALRESLFNALNQKRVNYNQKPFEINNTLNTVAQNFVEHLVINAFYSHMDKWGKKPQARVTAAGYKGVVSESLVWKKTDIESAVAWWEESDLHWKNIMKSAYTNVGIGITEEPDGGYMIILLTGE